MRRGFLITHETVAFSIDTHYGAIASKAVKLQPSELNVPDKGKAGFEKMFGESWDSAIAAGKVYNAKDGAAKLGLDSEGLNKAWSKLSRGKNLIKFGGGFYCGKVGDIYVMNGFYMRYVWHILSGLRAFDVLCRGIVLSDDQPLFASFLTQHACRLLQPWREDQVLHCPMAS